MPLPISGVPHSIATSPLKVTGYDVQADGLASPPMVLKSFYVENFSQPLSQPLRDLSDFAGRLLRGVGA